MKVTLFLILIVGIAGRVVSEGDTTAAASTGIQRTVIFIEKHVSFGEFVFVRGGIDHDQREGCTDDADTSPCALSITHNIEGTSNTDFNNWVDGDDFLDWYGAESNQGDNNGVAAKGTPMVWTTNDANYNATVAVQGYGYTELNTWGEHYWMVDVDMDCSETANGWFELKGIGPPGETWETDISQDSSCGGDAGDGALPYSSGNHFARCGYINKFTFNSNACYINTFPE